jgi:hypothetical protein
MPHTGEPLKWTLIYSLRVPLHTCMSPSWVGNPPHSQHSNSHISELHSSSFEFQTLCIYMPAAVQILPVSNGIQLHVIYWYTIPPKQINLQPGHKTSWHRKMWRGGAPTGKCLKTTPTLKVPGSTYVYCHNTIGNEVSLPWPTPPMAYSMSTTLALYLELWKQMCEEGRSVWQGRI